MHTGGGTPIILGVGQSRATLLFDAAAAAAGPAGLTPGSRLPARRRRVDRTAAGQPAVWVTVHFAADGSKL